MLSDCPVPPRQTSIDGSVTHTRTHPEKETEFPPAADKVLSLLPLRHHVHPNPQSFKKEIKTGYHTVILWYKKYTYTKIFIQKLPKKVQNLHIIWRQTPKNRMYHCHCASRADRRLWAKPGPVAGYIDHNSVMSIATVRQQLRLMYPYY